jgi:hypothetical protein
VRTLLKALWNRVPLAPETRRRLKAALPYALQQPIAALRRWGTVSDLYPWVVEDGLDTVVWLQNHFSVFYPSLDTSTRATLWLYDAAGAPLGRKEFPLGHLATVPIPIAAWVEELGDRGGSGTLLWHIVLPEAVARLPETRERHAYYVDRGYIAFVGRDGQTSFMHGIDRYAVFQEAEAERWEPFYPSRAAVRWRPEVPLGPWLGCETLEVLTVNRALESVRITLRALDASRRPVAVEERVVPARGLFRARLERALLEGLGDAGSLEVEGLPTQWSRVMILRRFASGAVSPMHC